MESNYKKLLDYKDFVEIADKEWKQRKKRK